MNKVYFFICFALLSIIYVLFPYKWKIYEVERKGIIVLMEIHQMLFSCIGVKNPCEMILTYQGKYYKKKGIGGTFLEKHKQGDVIKVKYIPFFDEVRFMGDSMLSEIILMLVIIAVCLFYIIKNFTCVVKRFFKKD